MFKKFFGKKNDGFFMQVEDDAPTPKVPAKAKPTEPAVVAPAATPAAVVAAPAAVVAAPAAVTATAPSAEVAKSTPLTPAEKKVADGEKAVAKAAAKAEKKSAKKADDEKKVAAVAAAAVAAAPAPPTPITNFATDYLIKPSSDSSRRRPGANMNKFLELAREAKIPVNIKK